MCVFETLFTVVPPTGLVMLVLVAVLSGMAKTGVYGVGMVSVPLMALIFGARESTGILLCLLICADFFGVAYYRQHADWSALRKLIPTALVGVVLGTYLGVFISDTQFQLIMAVTILVCVALMTWQEISAIERMPDSRWFAPVMGVISGFTTMVGNLGGPVMGLYLLAMRYAKQAFIGTAAWFFLTINLLKVPFHVAVWNTIDWQIIGISLSMLPFVALGAWFGVSLIKRVNEVWFRRFVIVVTAISAIVLLIQTGE